MLLGRSADALDESTGRSNVKIYCVNFDRFDHFALSAVIIASSPEEATKQLALTEEDTNVEAVEIGLCTDGTTKPRIVAEESL